MFPYAKINSALKKWKVQDLLQMSFSRSSGKKQVAWYYWINVLTLRWEHFCHTVISSRDSFLFSLFLLATNRKMFSYKNDMPQLWLDTHIFYEIYHPLFCLNCTDYTNLLVWRLVFDNFSNETQFIKLLFKWIS